MKKKLPNIYKNDKIINTNNKSIFKVNSSSDTYNNNDNNNVSETIRKLFKTNKYIFNIGVIIETDSKKYDTKIAGKIKNSIVTVDGDTIPIIEIKNIIIKDRV